LSVGCSLADFGVLWLSLGGFLVYFGSPQTTLGVFWTTLVTWLWEFSSRFWEFPSHF